LSSSLRLTSACAVALLLGGCGLFGFHWAGSRPLPAALTSVYIDVVTPYRVSKPPIEQALASRLLRRGARLSSTLGGARTILRISDLTETREVLSVDPFGKAVEFKLTTRVQYLLVETGGDTVPAATIQVSRDYSFNAQQVLAKEAEEQRLQSFMQDELAELLLLRLEAVLAARPAAPAGEPPPS
jgi:LPS-assembly lipoprotein